MHQPTILSTFSFSAIHATGTPTTAPVQFMLITDERHTAEQVSCILAGTLQPESHSFTYYNDFSKAIAAHSSTDKLIVFAKIAMAGFFDFLQKIDQSRVRIIALIDDIADELLAARLLELEYIMKQAIQPEAILKTLDFSYNQSH
ncbi:MAG: hypothetical protein ABW007_26075 [Chitinophagaceae bacterium]